jgi:hypothetical protein
MIIDNGIIIGDGKAVQGREAESWSVIISPWWLEEKGAVGY